jgi:hypothetical protein
MCGTLAPWGGRRRLRRRQLPDLDRAGAFLFGISPRVLRRIHPVDLLALRPVGLVRHPELALRLGEEPQGHLIRIVLLLRQALEEVDDFDGRVVVAGRCDDLLAARRILDLAEVLGSALRQDRVTAEPVRSSEGQY